MPQQLIFIFLPRADGRPLGKWPQETLWEASSGLPKSTVLLGRIALCRLHRFQAGVPGARAKGAARGPHRVSTMDSDGGDQAICGGPHGDPSPPALPIDFCRGNEHVERDRITEDWNRAECRPKRVTLQPLS